MDRTESLRTGCLGTQENTEIQDYPIPEHYFNVPMTQVFDLLAQEFIDFRQKRPA